MPQCSPQPDPSRLIAELALDRPLVGFYDAPDPEAFAPLVAPKPGPGRGPCVFHFYRCWLKGETRDLTADNFGCGGCGRAFFGVQTRERDDLIDFLWGDEGLRPSRQLMVDWVDNAPTYRPEHGHVLVGPLKPALATSGRSRSGSTRTSSACSSTAPTTITPGGSRIRSRSPSARAAWNWSSPFATSTSRKRRSGDRHRHARRSAGRRANVHGDGVDVRAPLRARRRQLPREGIPGPAAQGPRRLTGLTRRPPPFATIAS
jgi:hypothetical protein